MWGVRRLKNFIALFGFLLLLAAGPSLETSGQTDAGFTALSWNVSGEAFASHPDEFRALLASASPDLVLLDEVAPSTSAEKLRAVLPPSANDPANDGWQVSIGSSGGRQRDGIATRQPIEELPEFAGIIPYPESARRMITERMNDEDRTRYAARMDDGIAVNGAIVHVDAKRLLVVIADLECCGNDPASWAELKRRVEATEIRRLVRQVLARSPVDGVVLAGDFNLVSTPIPLVLMSGPYEGPHAGLIAAEVHHKDGITTWTWTDPDSPFPSRALDYQLYSPDALRVQNGYVLETDGMSADELAANGLRTDTASLLSDHRPVVVEYSWR
jgi:exonuclease III